MFIYFIHSVVRTSQISRAHNSNNRRLSLLHRHNKIIHNNGGVDNAKRETCFAISKDQYF
jgi:hypothetical protein